MDPDSPSTARRPLNRPDNEPLRKVEVAFFCLVLLGGAAAFFWRGLLFLRDGRAVFPLIGLVVPEPAGTGLGVAYLLLGAGVALAVGFMWIRFR